MPKSKPFTGKIKFKKDLTDLSGAGVILIEVQSPIKTDFEPPIGPAHIDHPSNKHGNGRCDCASCNMTLAEYIEYNEQGLGNV